MSYELFIAKRFLKANRKRGMISFINTFAILGITIGTAALIVALAIVGGFEKELKEKVIGFTSHIQVTGFQNKPLQHYQETSEKILKQVSNVKSVSPFTAKEVLIRSKENIEGVFLKGIEEEEAKSFLNKYLTEDRSQKSEVGSFQPQIINHKPQIILGKQLANKLNVKLGDKLIVFDVPNMKDGIQPRAKQFVVAGLYETGMSEYDDVVAFTDLHSAQKLFQLESAVSGFDVMVNDISQTGKTSKEIQKLAGYPHYSQTVFELYRNLFSWLELQKKPIPLILGLITIVAVVNIIGALLMLILERTKDIGILKSLGASNNEISKIFLVQGMFIGITGMIFGNILGLSYCLLEQHFHFFSLNANVYFMSTVPILLKWENFVIVSSCVLVLSFLASLIPSRAVSKINVIDTLRFA
ncbi:MAG: ABC transporter permease [Ignavibacteriales bacterium]|nr:ABC transporter permease [Ignavibacteriales bacterium]